MDESRIVVVVEEVEVARTALQWALHNPLRYGDTITLLHVFPANNSGGRSSKSKLKKNRLLRLKGFQLALSFQDICNTYSNVTPPPLFSLSLSFGFFPFNYIYICITFHIYIYICMYR